LAIFTHSICPIWSPVVPVLITTDTHILISRSHIKDSFEPSDFRISSNHSTNKLLLARSPPLASMTIPPCLSSWPRWRRLPITMRPCSSWRRYQETSRSLRSSCPVSLASLSYYLSVWWSSTRNRHPRRRHLDLIAKSKLSCHH